MKTVKCQWWIDTNEFISDNHNKSANNKKKKRGTHDQSSDAIVGASRDKDREMKYKWALCQTGLRTKSTMINMRHLIIALRNHNEHV